MNYKHVLLCHIYLLAAGGGLFVGGRYAAVLVITAAAFVGISEKLGEKSRLIEYVTSLLLGFAFSYSIANASLGTSDQILQLHLYLASLCVYHFMEYTFVLVYHYEDLKFGSFLINQSSEYVFAILSSFAEYFIELTLFKQEAKLCTPLFYLGLSLTLLGHTFRIGSMFTAKSNFTHLVSYKKKRSHVLVTSGLYGLSRHPSYFGFFCWSVGTQLMCCNPICSLGFCYTLWNFFNERIMMEEFNLIKFFGREYTEYSKRVGVLLPCKSFIKHKSSPCLKATPHVPWRYTTKRLAINFINGLRINYTPLCLSLSDQLLVSPGRSQVFRGPRIRHPPQSLLP